MHRRLLEFIASTLALVALAAILHLADGRLNGWFTGVRGDVASRLIRPDRWLDGIAAAASWYSLDSSYLMGFVVVGVLLVILMFRS